MAYTLGRLLDDEVVKGCQPMTNNIEWKSRTINTIMVHELPMEDFLQEGEVVLTTALGGWEYASEESIIEKIIEEASAGKASGVIFSLFSTKHITPELIDKAEKLNLPIFTIPWESTFSEVQRTVNDAIRRDYMERYRTLQDELFEAYFKSPELDPVIGIIEKTLEVPVALYDKQNRCISKSKSYKEGTWKVIIGSLKRPYGALYIEGNPPQDEFEELIQQYIGYPMSLWFNEIQVEELTTVRLRSDIATTLARGTYRDFGEVVKQAKMLDLDLNKPYYCIVLSIFGGTSMYRRKILESVVDIMTMAQRECKTMNRSLIIGNTRNRFVMYLERPKASTTMKEDPIVNIVEENIMKMLPKCWCLWGFSDIDNHELDFVRMYNEATLAMKYCDRDNPSNQRIYYTEAKILRIMSAVSADSGISGDAEKVMGEILEYDKGHGSMELMKTLTTFIKNNYNASKTARSLNIHRQSLLARLDKIESMTGLSLDEKDDLFILEVYSRMYKSY